MKEAHLDLAPYLHAWEYKEGNNARRVRTSGGREVIQVRLPLGIEQYEIHGRPDGIRPHQQESWFAYYQRKAEKAPWDFTLGEESFERLYQECLLYYYRYLLFFQINEFKLCARDTLRNLQVLDFVAKNSPEDTAVLLEQYRPYILRMHVMARALDAYHQQEDVESACRLLKEGERAIERLPPIKGNQIFELEKIRSLKSLRELYDQLRKQLPPSPSTKLKEKLQEAIRVENYEEAARLRDELTRIEKYEGR